MAELKEKNVLVLHGEQALADWLFDDLGVFQEDGAYRMELSGYGLNFYFCEGDDSAEAIEAADMILGLARFLDVDYLDRLVALSSPILDHPATPTAFLLYREEGEGDYKMSCPYCGQKLWVRDVDVDKRGRCPNCKKGFTLPRQEDLIVGHLRLRDAVLVKKITRGNPSSISGPIQGLFRIMDGGMAGNDRRAASKAGTLKVELPE